jgi:hypothetical protein
LVQSEKRLGENANIQNVYIFADGILGLLLEMSQAKTNKKTDP